MAIANIPGANYPSFFSGCITTNEEALRRVVRSGSTIASGFATSEPTKFYATVWDHILREDVHDLNFRQGLFMAPHPLLLGDAMQSQGLLKGWLDNFILAGFARKVNITTKKLETLKRLIAHYEELRRRRITFTSAFMGAATNAVIPSNAVTRTLFADYVGRNTSRMGITLMQSIHFPDAVDAMGFDADEKPVVDSFVLVMTPPNEHGEMSHSISNGANGEVLDKALRLQTMTILLYVNPRYPFVRGYGDARNTVNIREFEPLARAGRLIVVEDDTEVPSLPAGALANPSEVERKVAENVVNHIEMNLRYTAGRAIQVGFGGIGVLAIRGLKASSWTGRCCTEMLEPGLLDLMDAGKIAGTHFIDRQGRRSEIDGKLIATFSIAEQGSGFYERLHNNPNTLIVPASRIVIPEAFHYGLGINNCLSIDFHGHVNAGGRDKNHFSGVGGGAMINRGLGVGGVSYLCMKSTHTTPEGKTRSSIFSFMPRGTPLAYIGPDLMGGREGARFFLATEHGVTQLSGKNQHEFIRGLISVADPRFREGLRREAWREFRCVV